MTCISSRSISPIEVSLIKSAFSSKIIILPPWAWTFGVVGRRAVEAAGGVTLEAVEDGCLVAVVDVYLVINLQTRDDRPDGNDDGDCNGREPIVGDFLLDLCTMPLA